jgi:hypothetical protein
MGSVATAASALSPAELLASPWLFGVLSYGKIESLAPVVLAAFITEMKKPNSWAPSAHPV